MVWVEEPQSSCVNTVSGSVCIRAVERQRHTVRTGGAPRWSTPEMSSHAL